MAQIILPLAINAVIQIDVTVAIAYVVLLRLLGRDYEAAVTVGGFLGFDLSSMPTDGDDDPTTAAMPRRRLLAFLGAGSAALLGLSACVPAQQSAPGTGAPLSNPQLEQLLAPIALYPDALLGQLLIAATYPLEIVQAQRWLARGGNAQLRGTALEQALDRES